MDYEIYPSDNGQYIVLEVHGEINREIAMQQNLEAHSLGKELGISRYLVDVRSAVNTDRFLDKHEFAYKDMVQTEGIDKGAVVATVVSEGDSSHDYIETVSRNAGFNVTMFTDIEEAKAFLTGG